MTIEEIQKLRYAETKARRARIDAEKEFDEITLKPKLKQYIGRCFVFTNSFGGEGDTWLLYIKVLSLDGTTFKVERFQTSVDDRILIDINREEHNWNHPTYEEPEYKEISVDEYGKAKKELIEKLFSDFIL